MEHLDVLVIGAGLSGVGAGAYLERECPWADYAVFEAREAIGGTWDLFRYPGIRSDSDMFTLGYSFRPWDGEHSIADGPSILRYIEDTARETGVDKHIRFHHKIVAAEWSTTDAQWIVTAQRSDTGETFQLSADFVFACTGYYRYDEGYTPEFPGAELFRGEIVHPQHWPEDLDYDGKRIVVIGSGATAVTLIPSLAKTASHVTMLQRSPTYIVSMPAKDPVAQLLRRLLPQRFNAPIIRWFKALTTQASYFVSQRQPALVKRALRRQLERQLPAGYDIDRHFTPSYNPWDQRLCLVPNGDLFKAIGAGSASVVTDTVNTFDATGIVTDSGEHLDADIIVTATGLDLLFLGGMSLTVDGEPVDVSTRLAYKGMMLEGVPNMAMAIGYTNASWTLKCDLTCDYVVRLLDYMRREGFGQCTPTNTDAGLSAAPLLGLKSGYIQRAEGRMPKQGSKFPWQVKQSYLADFRVMKLKPVTDAAMVFSNHRKAEAVHG
ncbi:MAG TPA: NAD(P)/FAD-dependent oxidoreductase [Acidimicrobiales bacterium]|nr:NAD(P)/FAD-dependent oxidoreductase [Acidimicrobiales bacterium]